MLKNLFFCSFFNFLILTSSFNQEAIIKGVVPMGDKKIIRLYSYENLLTLKPTKIMQDSIRKDTFCLKIPLQPNECKPVSFRIEKFYTNDFFIEPNNTYFIVFDSIKFELQDEVFNFKSPLLKADYQILEPQNDINTYIDLLYSELDNFNQYDFKELAGTRNKKIFNKLKNRLDSLFKNVNHPYFEAFVKFSLAEIEFISQISSRETILHKYFHKQTFLYDNVAFMNFFSLFFDKYIFMSSKHIKQSELSKFIIEQKNYKALIDTLGRDTLLRNEVIRDMVLLYNLSQMYYENLFPKKHIYEFLIEYKNNTKFPLHSKLAEQLINELDAFSTNRLAPELVVRNEDYEKIKLEDFTTLYVYLYFFNTKCKPCVKELFALEKLAKEYNNRFNFLAVSTDVNFLNYYYFMQDFKFSFEITNFNKNFDMLEKWNITVLPQAYIISPKNQIINSFAPLPAENLKQVIDKILSAN